MEWNKNIFLNLFRLKKKEKEKDYCFGLILKEDEGGGLILEIDHQQKEIRKIDEKKFIFSDSWERLTEDVDEVLFELENNSKTRVGKVIFFLSSHLIDQKTKQIKIPYLKKIKQLVKELGLKPLGYIECHEALSLYLNKKEEEPLTAIIVELDKQSVASFIYQRGELISSDSAARTEDLVSDLEIIFKRIRESIILPSRIIIYNSEALGGDLNKITSHRWREDLFIQIPRLENIAFEELKEALIFSFSQQMFLEMEEKVAEERKEEVMGFVIGKDIKEKDDYPLSSTMKIKEKKIVLPPIKINLRPPFFYPLVIGIVFLIIFSIFSLLYFFHKALVTIYFQGKRIEKELNIDKNQLLIKKIDEIVEREDSIATTGKKIIGEKAKGEVTIYNLTLAEKEFKKETILETTDGIKFSLNSDVKVASASQSLTGEGDLLTVTGKTKTKVTAVEIGPGGNIGKDRKLKIDGFSLNLVFGLSNDSFTGGTRQQIQTVSKDDMEKLKETLLQKIKNDGILRIKNKMKDKQVIDKLTKVEIVSEKFSKEVGEEAKILNLKASGKATFFTFDREDMRRVIFKNLTNSIESNYELVEKSIDYRLKEAKEESDKIILTVLVLAKTVPREDKKQLIHQLTGKKRSQVEAVVKKKLGAAGYEIRIETKIPFLNFRLPFFEKNIQLRIESL